MSHVEPKEDIRGHSGWLIPALLLFATLLLSGLFLGWYLRPGPKVPASPTDQSTLIPLTVRGMAFKVPANFLLSPPARTGGAQDSVTLVALFPSWHGYSDAAARLFNGNAPDSPVVRLSLRGDDNPLDAQTRLMRVYMPYVRDPDGKPGPFGLTQYSFASNTGYEREDLFVGQNSSKLLLFLCEQPAPELPSPNCLAIDQPLGTSTSLSYRFKRSYLSHWRELSSGVDALIARFRQNRGH